MLILFLFFYKIDGIWVFFLTGCVQFCFFVFFCDYGQETYFPACKTSWVASTEERVHLFLFHFTIL